MNITFVRCLFCHIQEVEVVVVAVVVGVVVEVEVEVVVERYQIDDARFHVFPLDLTKNWKDAGAGMIFACWQFQRKYKNLKMESFVLYIYTEAIDAMIMMGIYQAGVRESAWAYALLNRETVASLSW